MKILVTGGAGFIGSHVVDAYLAAGHTVAVLDDFSSGKKSNVPKGVEIFEGSIIEPDFVKDVFTKFQPEIINHHAAQISVSVSVREPRMDARRNIIGTINLLEAAITTPSFKKFIYATSGGAMYGRPAELPLHEESPAQAISPYGLSKYVAERYVWLFAEMHDLKATVLRYSNIYGPRQDPHGEAGVCSIFTDRMLEGLPVTIYGDGSQQRDYVYVGDVAEANIAALSNGEGQAYNISTGIATSTQEVYDTLRDATGYKLKATMEPDRPGDLQLSVLTNSKAQNELGWMPTFSFKEGITKTVEWAKSR